MNILMNFKHHLKSKHIADQLTELVRSKLSKFLRTSDTVKLFFEDINGIRRGFDKRCTLVLVPQKGKIAAYSSIGRNEAEGLRNALKKIK